jgi:ABC transporter with metal-binding/Fe-S-binding domain ATP-binding protein
MRVAGLFSGGKDSTYAARIAQKMGHQLSYLVSVIPRNPDSYMFHTVNLHLAPLQAKSWGISYIELETLGKKENEIYDLKEGLAKLDIDGVVSGAIASNYQRARLNRICKELGLEHISPLWARERELLIREMLSQKMLVIFSAVAAYGLDDSWLGKVLNESSLKKIVQLNRDFGVDISGEGGEYESLVLDAPWFKERIEIIKAEKCWDGISGKYKVKKARLVQKIHKD